MSGINVVKIESQHLLAHLLRLLGALFPVTHQGVRKQFGDDQHFTFALPRPRELNPGPF
jgi:hypothetical protein